MKAAAVLLRPPAKKPDGERLDSASVGSFNSADGSSTVDRYARIAAATRELLVAIGDDPARPGLVDTPDRVARMFTELFGGLSRDPRLELSTVFEEGHSELVLVRDIPFFSVCEHHLLPFYGHVHFGYVPNGRIVGLSKIARLIDCLARRPQIQERFTCQIADIFNEELCPQGVGVVVEAQHLCMEMRGVKKPGSRMVTSAVRGALAVANEYRAEFLMSVRPS